MDSDAARLLIKQELADGGVCRNTASQGSGGRIQFLVKCSQILDQLVATSGGQSFDGQIERLREAVRSGQH
jgi:hypothetical protein